jgi:methyl-accepting chemotaxis protein
MNYPWVKKANRTFIFVLMFQFVFGLVIAYFTDTWTEAFILGALITAFPFLLLLSKPYETFTHHIVAIAVQLNTALHIHQAQGLTEIHFEIFSLLAILIFYRNWKVILTSVLVVAVHHVLFFILQAQSMPFYIFEQGDVYFYILVIHALFAVTEAAVLMYIAHDSFLEATASNTIKQTVDEVLKAPEKFDLSVTLDEKNKELNDFNRLISSFKQFIEQSKLVSNEAIQLAQSAEAATHNIETITTGQTSRVAQINTAVEEMAATNHEVSRQANDSSEHANQANASTIQIQQIIGASNKNVATLEQVITSTAETIQSLSSKCNRIADVMTAITSISEQTNLLALNAAIESARAGEHGRGFAVVADEVRQLATKTRENAEEIHDVVNSLISDANLSVEQMASCIEQVKDTVKNSEQMSLNVENVVEGIAMVTRNIDGVSSSVAMQVDVSQDISDAIRQLTDDTHQQVEEMHTSLEQIHLLQNQIEILHRELNKFVV